MERLLSIAVVFNHTVSFNRQVLAGVGDYARTKPDWVLVPFAAEPRTLASARCRACAGLIGHLYSDALATAAVEMGIPVVTVSGLLSEYPIPRVATDHAAIGRLAAEHFIERGYRQFAFVGYSGLEFSDGRYAGFQNRLDAEGRIAERLFIPGKLGSIPTGPCRAPRQGLEKWLTRLPRPIAIFAANAAIGFWISVACHEIGLNIPEEVALLDVDYDQLQSQLSNPPTSSVALPAHRMGYEGAQLLDQLISGSKPSTTKIILPPIGVVVRQSSDALAIEDEAIARAASFIRMHRQTPLSVMDVVRHVNVSRCTLERKFRKMVGHSLAEEIRRSRRERAKTLLVSSELSIANVAEQSGYPGNIELSVDFRKYLGLTPTEYRRKFRSGGNRI
ncbi:MAG: DNA-binding transcriptional regulator [Pirellulaceae bacterium]|jgi:LacI family transcriptional regulator|nr:DNA-binding transcriptional regulator [Pirellulaceae bacterium]